MPKSGAERQRTLQAKRTAAGWKKMWIPPSLITKVQALIKQIKEQE